MLNNPGGRRPTPDHPALTSLTQPKDNSDAEIGSNTAPE